MMTPSTAPSYLTSRRPCRRQLKNSVRYQLEPDLPILARPGLVVSIAAHIDGEVEAVPRLPFFCTVAAPNAYLGGRGRFRRLPQQFNQSFRKAFVTWK